MAEKNELIPLGSGFEGLDLIWCSPSFAAIKVKFMPLESISGSQNHYITEKLSGLSWRY
jgi:hypothetical protein